MQTDAATVTAGDITIDSNHENADQIALSFVDDPTPAVSPDPAPEARADPAAPETVEAGDADKGPEATATIDPETVAKTRRRDPRAAVQSAIAKQREAERRAEIAEARLDAVSTATAAPSTPPAEPPPDWMRYKAMAAAPKADHFENYDDYTAALATFVTDARQHDYETRRAQYFQDQDRQESQAAHTAQWQDRLTQARTDNPDLDATLDPEVPMSLPMQHLAMESPVGIQLLQYLSAHPDESQRLSTLHPAEVYRAMGKLEERLTAAPSSVSGPAPGISHAKPPIQPLGSSPHTPDTTEIGDDLSFDEHFKRMNAADRKSGLL
jgi:hypothetical protein